MATEVHVATQIAETTPPIIASPSPSQASGATTTPVPIATRTPVPTLTSDQVNDAVPDLLRTNGGCDLPCWWGVVPGQTSHELAKSLFESKGIPLTVDNSTNVLLQVGHKANGDFAYWLNTTLSISDTGIIQIRISAEANGRQASLVYTQDFDTLRWDNLMAQLGQPSRVQLSVMHPSEPGAPFEYYLELGFDRASVEITYIGPADGSVVQGDSLRLCPRFGQVSTMDLFLYSAESGGKIDTAEHARSIDINPKEFYEGFQHAERTSCMKWPLNNISGGS
jgi:hypothetical protein